LPRPAISSTTGDDPGEGRLADPAQRQAGQGDAELGGGEIGVEVAEHVPRQAGPPVALRDVGLDLRRPHLDQGELGGDEEAVQSHQQEGEEQPPRRADLEAAGPCGEKGEREDAHGRLLAGSPGGTPDGPLRTPWERGGCWPE